MADSELNPLLAEAYRAERAVETSATAGLSALRERMLLAAAARRVPFWSVGKLVAALLAAGVLAGGLGFWVGRGTAGSTVVVIDAGPVAVDAGVIDADVIDAGPVEAAPIDAGAADAAPLPAKRAPRSGELNEPLLIDQARVALRRQLVDDAIAALAEHERRYPDGQLVEEREVLRIEADLMKGDRASAAARIERYRQRFPDGFLREHVDGLLGR